MIPDQTRTGTVYLSLKDDDIHDKYDTYRVACLGIGKYNVTDMFVGKSNINDFRDNEGNVIDYNVIDKYELISMFSSYPTGMRFDFGWQKTPDEIASINFNEPYFKIENVTVSDSRIGQIDAIMINLAYPSGLHGTSSKGNNTTKHSYIRIYVKDEFGYLLYDKNFDISGETSKLNKLSLYIPVQPHNGNCNITVIRNSGDETTNKTMLDFTIDEIYVRYNMRHIYDKHKDIYHKMTFMLIEENNSKAISPTGGKKVSVDIERVDDNNIKLWSVRDFLKDMWENKDYGMGESIDKLEERYDTRYTPLNIYIRKKTKILKLIYDVLNNKGFDFYPSRGKFVVRKNTKKKVVQMLFTKRNTVSIEITQKMDRNLEYSGVEVEYYPNDSVIPEKAYYDGEFELATGAMQQIQAIGIDNYEDAIKIAKREYIRRFTNIRYATVKTGVEGLIPELTGLVKVSNEFVDNAVYATVTDHDDEGITVSEMISFKEGDEYIITLADPSNVIEVGRFIANEEKTDNYIQGNYDVKNGDILIIHTAKTEIIDFIVKSINYDKQTDEITLELEEYIEELYDD